MDRLDLRQVEYFVAVAEELHFGRAAERLLIAQPSLSQQIRRLETQLGIALFRRTSRRVELTAAGDAFLAESHRLLTQAQRTLEAARSQERLVIGFVGSAGARLLAPTVSAYAELAHAVRVVPTELPLSATEEIRSGVVDIAFTRLTPAETDLRILILAHEPRLAALPASHRYAAREEPLRFADLRGERFVTSHESFNPEWRIQWHAEQTRHGLEGQVAAEATSIEELLTLVATGVGVCIVPAPTATFYPRPGIIYRSLTDADATVTSLAWAPASERPALRDFRDVAARIASD